MIDLHCHYLPGIDDGAKTLSQALELARASVANGIREAVLTPHIFAGRWDNSLSVIQPVFDRLKAELMKEDIPLTVYLGGEVHLLPESLAMLDQHQLPFIGGWRGQRVLLLELPDAQLPVGGLRAVEYLRERGVIPLIAHPERNKEVMRNFRKIEPYLQAGCLLQVTAASVCGWFGKNAHKTALQLIDNGWVFAIATDAHNLKHRPPVLAEARMALDQRYGAPAGDVLTQQNAAQILAGRLELGIDNDNVTADA